MSSDPADVVAEARKVYWALQDQQLAASALGQIAEWVATGEAPPAERLRKLGFASAGESGPQSDFWFVQRAFARNWGFAIPCAEMVTALLPLVPLVEVGAGSGYLTAFLCAAGLDVIATDAAAGDQTIYGFVAGARRPVERLDGVAAVSKYSDRNVLCSWPTKGSAWALAAARRLAIGRAFILIGQVNGATTGTPGLRHFLRTRFEQIDEVAIPQFPGAEDRLMVFRRTR